MTNSGKNTKIRKSEKMKDVGQRKRTKETYFLIYAVICINHNSANHPRRDFPCSTGNIRLAGSNICT